MTEEENRHTDPASGAPDLGKFKNVEALARAYRELEAEFTRRSQRLKALEEASRAGGTETQSQPPSSEASEREIPPQDSVLNDDEAIYTAAMQHEEVRKRIVGEYLDHVRGVPLMAGGGAPVRAPARRIASIGEAGKLALGYLRNQKL